MTVSKSDIQILLKQAIAASKGALLLMEEHDKGKGADETKDAASDILINGAQYRAGEDMRSAVEILEQRLRHVEFLMEKEIIQRSERSG